MTKFFVLAIICTMLASCSFDSMFLFPEKIPHDAKEVTIVAHQTGETLLVEIGDQFQPTFKNRDGEPVDLGYQIESTIFENEIGNELNGWIMHPDTGYNGSTVVFFHGNAVNLFSHYRQAEPLVRNGFSVLIFDYSGYGFSQGTATRDNVLKDARAAMSYIEGRTDLKRDNLLLYGQSLGGHLVAYIAAKYQDQIDAAVVEGAFSSSNDIASKVAGFVGRILVANKYSGVEAIQSYHKPLLVIHSTEDETIPFELGKKLYSNANEPKRILETTGCHMCGIHNYTETIVGHIHEMIK